MERYIFGARSNIHIIDLSQTMPLLHQALVKVREVAAGGGRVLFVGTKRQASEPVAAAAKRCAQYYVNHRWLGGTLTNWRTISASIARLRELEGVLEGGEAGGRPKKELLQLTRERDKLELSLGGIKDMGGIPDLMFVIDTNKEAIAIQEARKLNIPVIAILDTNSDPQGITFPVPGNDDAARALQLYCDLVADAVLDGLTEGQAAMGVDIGAAEDAGRAGAGQGAGGGQRRPSQRSSEGAGSSAEPVEPEGERMASTAPRPAAEMRQETQADVVPPTDTGFERGAEPPKAQDQAKAAAKTVAKARLSAGEPVEIPAGGRRTGAEAAEAWPADARRLRSPPSTCQSFERRRVHERRDPWPRSPPPW